MLRHSAAKLAGDVLAPLNQPGDAQGAALTKDGVIAADGFAVAYRRFVENGWNGLSADPEFGGQGLPGVIVNSASLSRTTAGPPGYATAGLGPPRNDAAALRSVESPAPPAEPHPAISAAAANRAHVRRVIPTQDVSAPAFVPDRCGAGPNRPR